MSAASKTPGHPVLRPVSDKGMHIEYHTIHDYRRAYRIAGSGPALLLLHGIGDNSSTWNEVIPTLNLPTKWFWRAEPLAVGDAVMLPDESRRGCWTRGRVVETFKGGRDDQVRQVKVQTATGYVMRPSVKVARI